MAEQERAGREWAETVGGDVVQVYRVPGHTRDLWNFNEAAEQMPAYALLRRDCEAKRLDALWCYDPDRLGRKPALALAVVALLQENGASVFVENGGYLMEPGQAPQMFMFAFQSTQAGVEQEKRVHRHHFGMRGRIEAGLHPNHWPYGYRPVRNGSGEVTGGEFDPSEIGAIRQMTRWYLDGDGYTTIARRLNESDWVPRRARKWWPATVRYMLYNDTYAAVVEFGDSRARSDRFPAAWNDETWRRVQQERDNRYKGGRKPVSPVSGVAYCNRCGYALDCDSHYADGDVRFVCQAHSRAWTGAYERCHRNTTKESVVIDFVDELLGHLDIVADVMDVSHVAVLRRRVAEADAQIEKTKEKQKRLALRVADGTIGVEPAKAANDDLQAELDAARATRDAAIKEMRLLPDPEEVRGQLEDLAGRSIRDWPLRKVRAALKRAKVKVFVEDGEVVRWSVG